MNNNNEGNREFSSLQQEAALLQNRLYRTVCGFIVLGGIGLYIEGAFNDAPKDSVAGMAAVGIVGAVVFLRSHGQTPSQPS